MSKIDYLYKLCSEFEQMALGPDETEEEVIADRDRRFGHLSEHNLISMIEKAKLREEENLIKWFDSKQLQNNEKYRNVVEDVKSRLAAGQKPRIEIKQEGNDWKVYVNNEWVASGENKKNALMNAAQVYLS
jgi:hypothetical protein